MNDQSVKQLMRKRTRLKTIEEIHAARYSMKEDPTVVKLLCQVVCIVRLHD